MGKPLTVPREVIVSELSKLYAAYGLEKTRNPSRKLEAMAAQAAVAQAMTRLDVLADCKERLQL